MMDWLRILSSPDLNFGNVTKNTIKSMSSITINGKTYTGKNSISIINGEVIIDGMPQSGERLTGVVRVEITGDPLSVTTDSPVVVKGDVKGDVKADGPVTCGEVGGNVEADGPVTCGSVRGYVEANGPCTCGNVGGNVTADMVMKS